MGLFDDIKPVPFRLLDELQAQMEANRERINIQQELKGLTRPRSQRSIFNATMSDYRRPEPAAHPVRKGRLAMAFITSSELQSNRVWRVYSGDGQQHVEWSEELQPVFNPLESFGPDPEPDIQYPNFDGSPQGGLHEEREVLFYPYKVDGAKKDNPGCGSIECVDGPWISFDYHEWRTGPGSQPRTFNEKKTDRGRGGVGGDVWVVLPLGNDRMILARRYHEDVRAVGFWAIRRHQSDIITELYETTQEDSCCSLTWYSAAYNGVFSNTTTSGEDGSYTFQATTEKCIFVSHNSIREISMPQELRQKLLEIVPEATVTQPITLEVEVFTADAFLTTPSGNPTKETLTYSTGVPSGPAAKAVPAFQRYGLTTTSSAISPVGSGETVLSPSSAGIYAALDNLGAQSFDPVADRSFYSSLAPLPDKWLFSCAGPSLCDTQNGLLNFAATNVIPPNYQMPSPSTLNEWPWTNRPKMLKGPLQFVGNSRTAVLAWDWDNPAYCTEQALNLGFTPADLTP